VAAVCGAALLVVLIGFSRMYLGVHYFSDVVAGYAAGGVWLSALITGAETIRRSNRVTKPESRTSDLWLWPVRLLLHPPGVDQKPDAPREHQG
jgi:membrane-associated phospholipid phosphatase